MSRLSLLNLILAGSLVLSSCHKDTTTAPTPPPTSPPAPTGAYLYTGGSFSNNYGIVWKYSLSQPSYPVEIDTLPRLGRITSMQSTGNTVYIAGQTGGYMLNDSFVSVPGASGIQSLALSGNNVYAAGFDQSGNLAYWVNNTETSLQNTLGRSQFPYEGTISYGTTGIALSGNNILVSGSLFFENEPFTPFNIPEGNFGAFWDNGALTVYGPGRFISAVFNATAGIAVAGGDVYVAGTFPDSTLPGGYWKNGVWNTINNGAFVPNAIVALGNDVYIPGYTYVKTPTSRSQQAAYWKKDGLVTLDGSNALAITVYQSDIYVAGIDKNNQLVIWKNGSLLETIGSGYAATATSLAVRSK